MDMGEITNNEESLEYLSLLLGWSIEDIKKIARERSKSKWLRFSKEYAEKARVLIERGSVEIGVRMLQGSLIALLEAIAIEENRDLDLLEPGAVEEFVYKLNSEKKRHLSVLLALMEKISRVFKKNMDPRILIEYTDMFAKKITEASDKIFVKEQRTSLSH